MESLGRHAVGLKAVCSAVREAEGKLDDRPKVVLIMGEYSFKVLIDTHGRIDKLWSLH
jgi:hypothetical protein